MAAHGDRRHVGALARPPREHRAHVVDGDGAAEFLRPRLEPVAHLTVEIGQRQPADAALGRAADFGGLHQVVPQPLGIDGEVFQGAFHVAHVSMMATARVQPAEPPRTLTGKQATVKPVAGSASRLCSFSM